MSNTDTTHAEFDAVVGIDWADATHAVCLWDAETNSTEQVDLTNRPETIEAWLGELDARYGGKRVAVSLEQSRGALMNQLAGREHLVIFAVNPATLARFRQAFAPSMRKSDPSDAFLLMDLVRTHHAKLHPRHRLDPVSQRLATLVEHRRNLVDLRVGLGNKLRQALKDTYPQAQALVGNDLHTTLAIDFLKRWPTLAELRRARPETVRKFYYGHHVRRKDVVERRIKSIQQLVATTTDEAILSPARLLILALCRQLAAVKDSIDSFDREIAETFAGHPDASIFESLPGAGPNLAPRLAAAFGQDRSRFDDASSVQRASGIAPVTISSGKVSRTCRRISKSSFLHQTFFEFASKSLQLCRWARAFYNAQRAAGKCYGSAVRALAFKWLRIIFACWKNHEPYDDARYTDRLSLRGSPHASTA